MSKKLISRVNCHFCSRKVASAMALFNSAFSSAKADNFLKNHEEVVKRLQAKSKQLTYLSQYNCVRDSIKKSVSAAFPHSSIEIHFFGSRIIGLGSDESDLDIYVDIDGKFHSTYVQGSDHDNKFQRVASALDANQDWTVKERVLRTRVPVIISVYRPLMWDCKLRNFPDLIFLTPNLQKATCHWSTEFQLATRSCSRTCLSSNRKQLRSIISSECGSKIKDSPLSKATRWPFLCCSICKLKDWCRRLKLFNEDCLSSLSMVDYPNIKLIQISFRCSRILGWSVQFDPNRTLRYYQVQEMTNYKLHVLGFFRYYRDFNYSNVIQPFNGSTLDSYRYKGLYRKFYLKGLLIAGPINKETNCGIMDADVKIRFIKLCKDTADFLANKTL